MLQVTSLYAAIFCLFKGIDASMNVVQSLYHLNIKLTDLFLEGTTPSFIFFLINLTLSNQSLNHLVVGHKAVKVECRNGDENVRE